MSHIISYIYDLTLIFGMNCQGILYRLQNTPDGNSQGRLVLSPAAVSTGRCNIKSLIAERRMLPMKHRARTYYTATELRDIQLIPYI